MISEHGALSAVTVELQVQSLRKEAHVTGLCPESVLYHRDLVQRGMVSKSTLQATVARGAQQPRSNVTK